MIEASKTTLDMGVEGGLTIAIARMFPTVERYDKGTIISFQTGADSVKVGSVEREISPSGRKAR